MASSLPGKISDCTIGSENQKQSVDFAPSVLCSSCAQWCSEEEWSFSIEDGRPVKNVNRFNLESFQMKNKSKSSRNMGRVLYRGPRSTMPCP
eukprot:Gb_19830 [translate_table: standard]